MLIISIRLFKKTISTTIQLGKNSDRDVPDDNKPNLTKLITIKIIINLCITLILLIINIHSSHAKLTKRVYIHINARTQHRYHRFAIALKPPDSLQVPGSRENRWSRNTKRKGDERNDQRKKKEEKKEKKEEA